MKKMFFVVNFLLFLALNAFAQEPTEEVNASIGKWEIGKAFTLVSDANVREKPNTQSTVLTQLAIGSEIKIEQVTTDSFTVNGFRAPWCQISFDNGKKKGYLWGGFIATVVLPMAYPDKDTEGVVFLGGVGTWDEKKHRMTMQLRAAKNGKELAKVEFLTPGDLFYDCTLKGEAKSGFKKVSKVLTFTTGYAACGYPWADNLIFFTKDKKLVRILATESVSGAGAFYASETYILPSDKGGITNHIIVTEDNAEMIEKGNDYEAVNQKYKITLHKWDGVKLIKLTK
jgi:Bacterial SH3 domain